MSWLEYFKKSDLNTSIIQTEIFERNILYISVLSQFAIGINLFHVILFYLNLNEEKSIEYIWRLGIIYSHTFMMFFFLFIAIVFNLYKKRGNFGKKFLQFLFFLIYLVVIIFGISLVVIDQYVTSAITPYLFMCILIPMTLLVRPLVSLVVFLTSYLLFYTFLPITQTNPSILLSSRVNGFSFTGIGIFLSLTMWRNAIRRFQQDRIIKQQKTDLENSYSELLITTDSLKIANSTKDKFFSIIAHDLRTPFNAILGFSDLIQSEFEEGETENVLQYLNFIKTSASHAHSLLENLLLWAKSQTGTLVYKPSLFIINDLIINIFQLLETNAAQKKISLSLNSSKEFKVFLDKEMLDTIFRNLISNSIKYTRESGQILVEITGKEDAIWITVSDNGIGMSEEQQKKLFNLSSNISTKGTNGETGSGLGLILCHEFVKLNNGTMTINSEPGKGTTFTVRFPAVMP